MEEDSIVDWLKGFQIISQEDWARAFVGEPC